MEKFCCEDMKEGWLSPSLEEIGEEAEKHPAKVQWYTTHDFPEDVHPVKKGELYLGDSDVSQIYGKPFKFCPWCGKKLLD